ncbi:MAG TPA: phosphoribosyltransferase family protein [Segetibacter sp.]|jgi:ComF family protein
MVSLKSSFKDFLHLIFPHVCTGCGSDVLNDKEQLCLKCFSELPSTDFFKNADNPVEQTFYGRLAVRNAAAGYFFTKESLLQHLLVQLKYRNNKDIGIYMGKLLGRMLVQSERFSQVDVMVPLPLNPKREKKRGYNQATALCNGISEVWIKPVIEKIIVRKVFTETQTHKGRISRWQNMDGVFEVTNASALQGKHILLVDDVVTTGATLEACGNEILKIPGTTLSIATLAYTI